MPWCVSCVSAEDTNCCYLGTDIFKGGRADKWKANQEHILKKNNNRRTLITLPRQHWHSFNAPVDAALVQLRGLIWTQVECDMDSTFPPCDPLAQGRFVAKTKEQKQELFHFLQQAPRQCIGTMDTRLCPVYMLCLTKRGKRKTASVLTASPWNYSIYSGSCKDSIRGYECTLTVCG